MFELKAVVFAKIKGHSIRPASVERTLRNRTRFYIIFLVIEAASCSEKDIFPFKDYPEDEMSKYKTSNKDFQKALDEANKALTGYKKQHRLNF